MPTIDPTAGTWKRFIVDKNYSIPVPISDVSPQFNQYVEEVAYRTKHRTEQNDMDIAFFAGGFGTEGPSGIWQNILYKESLHRHLSDKKYAHLQKILAFSVADSFYECWKQKYIYWYKRPSMYPNDIKMSMNNPNFPSYPSGHSTISATAYTVLSSLIPEKSAIFKDYAVRAKDSRINAGVHFSFDNENGFALGQKIGNDIINKLELEDIDLIKN